MTSQTASSLYDVFLNFRGDTRNSFTAYLYASLDSKGVKTFRDNEELQRGRPMRQELLDAIENSRIAIIVFSEDYASSTWCLDELVKIAECREERGLIVWPIFYHVEPSDVRHQRKTYKDALDEHEESFGNNIEKVERWRATLTEVANIRGEHLEPSKSETNFIQETVEKIIGELSKTIAPPSLNTMHGLIDITMHHYPLKSLPSWTSDKLKGIDLSDSGDFITTPDFARFRNLERLILERCIGLSKVHPSIATHQKLITLNLKGCKSLNSLPDEINLESLETLILSGCSSLKKFPEIGSNMTRLSELYADGTALEELPNSFRHLTGLTVLNLQHCNFSLYPIAVTNMTSIERLNLSNMTSIERLNLSNMTSIERLNLSGPLLRKRATSEVPCGLPSKTNTFEKVDDRIYSGLLQLPNLPSCAFYLMKRGCSTWLEKNANKVVVWTSGETGITSINCLRLADEEDCEITEVSLLGIQTQWDRYAQIYRIEGFHGVYPQTRIPEWFSQNGTIQLDSYKYVLGGIAMCAIFEVYEDEISGLENLNDVSPGQDSKYCHEFKCHLDMDGVRVHCPQVFNLSKDKYKAGSFGFWLYISDVVLRGLLDGRSCGITPSITTDSPGVEIKMCGARILYYKDRREFFEKLEHLKRPVPLPKLLPSIENIAEVGCTSPQTEIIAADTSRNPSLFFISLPYRNGLCGSTESRSILKSWFKNYMQGFYNKLVIFNHYFPQCEIPEWFCHHNSPSDSVTIQQPSRFYNDPDWMGFAFCAVFSFHKHPTAIRKNLNLRIPPRFMCHLETDLELDLGGMSPLLEHIMDEDEEEVLISLNRHAFIWVSFIPCGRVLSHISSQCSWVRFSFLTDSPNLLPVNCGVNLVYKQNMEDFTGTIVQCVTSYVDYLYSLRSSCDEVFYEKFPFYQDSCENTHPENEVHLTGSTMKKRYQRMISLFKKMLGRN